MKVNHESVEIDFENGRKLIIHDNFVQLYDETKGFPQTMNVPLDKLFAFAS